MWKNILRNWKTDTVSLIAFAYSIPEVVQCVKAWEHHQQCDWRMTVVSLLVGAAAAFAKDSTNHSTITEITNSTVKEEIKDSKVKTEIVVKEFKWDHPELKK